MAYRTVNPYNNQVVATFEDLTDAEAMNLLAQAQKTFESWSQTSYAERAAVCRRAAAILTERPDEFARLLTLEMGKLYNGELGRSCAEPPTSLPTTPTTPRRSWRPSVLTRSATTTTRCSSAPRSG